MLTWVPPTTLGDGLVHDTRFDIAAQQADPEEKDVTGLELAAGIGWSSFVEPHALKLQHGFRPTAVDADISLTGVADGEVMLEIVDRSAYAADNASNYRHETLTYIFADIAAEQTLARSDSAGAGEPRPVSIDTFRLPSDASPGDNIVWVYDNNPVPWTIVVGEETAIFAASVDSLTSKGYRPISVASRQHDDVSEYSAIFVQDGVTNADWRLRVGLDWTTLPDASDTAWAEGYYPVRGTYEQGSEMLPKFNVLWAKRSPELRLELRYNLDQALFDSEDASWRSQGYYLENATMYRDGGAERFAGVWVRHEPYFREEIADGFLDDADPTFAARYEIFEDQVIQSMTLEGEQKEGEYFRPSATLHIWEGSDLVINRAYTYAPAPYPDTPINASFAAASVSKSITAAAVVKVLAENDMAVTQTFDVAVGLANDWPGDAPTIADVLRNIGGFATTATALNYSDHLQIVNSDYGDLPVMEDEYFMYVVGEQLLDGGVNAHWSAGSMGVFSYSNPGFSMLGQLINLQSGVSYEEYVRTTLLAPLNFDDNIFADQGHRNTIEQSLASGATPLGQFEPVKSSLRKYLINTSHPYVCTDDPPCAPEVPHSGSTPSPAMWAANTAAANSSAPDTAAQERYAGSYFMGGAPLAAGGWHGDGKSLGEFMRVITRSELLMPSSVASQLWAPQWLLFENDGFSDIPAKDWAYGLGWYVRGNWVAWAGGSHGGSGLILHNLRHDFTVAILTNLIDNGFSSLHPLLTPTCTADTEACWGTSTLGALFPCLDDPDTVADECPAEIIY